MNMIFGYGTTLMATGEKVCEDCTIYYIIFRDTKVEHNIGYLEPDEHHAFINDPYLNPDDVVFAFTTREQRDRVYTAFNGPTT